jgi:hypothetical protein
MQCYSDPDCLDNVIIHSADNIRTHQQVMLSDGGLLLMALLCGGDYHVSFTPAPRLFEVDFKLPHC